MLPRQAHGGEFANFIEIPRMSTVIEGILVTLRELGTGIDDSETGVKYLAAS